MVRATREFSDAERNHIRKLYASGMGCLAIARVMASGVRKIYPVVADMPRLGRAKVDAAEIAKIRALYATGMTCAAVAERVGRSVQAVAHYTKDMRVNGANRSAVTVETAGAGHFVPGIPASAAQFPERITVRLPEHVARHARSLEQTRGMSREAALREAMRVEAAKSAAAVHNSTMERKRP